MSIPIEPNYFFFFFFEDVAVNQQNRIVFFFPIRLLYRNYYVYSLLMPKSSEFSSISKNP